MHDHHSSDRMSYLQSNLVQRGPNMLFQNSQELDQDCLKDHQDRSMASPRSGSHHLPWWQILLPSFPRHTSDLSQGSTGYAAPNPFLGTPDFLTLFVRTD